MTTQSVLFIAIIAIILACGAMAWPRADVLDLAPRRSWSFGKIALIVVCLLGIGGGTYLGRNYLQCQSLEEDYLNSFGSMKNIGSTLPLLGEGDARDALVILREQQKIRAGQTLQGIMEKCGIQAAETANRKATELVRL